MITIEIPGWGNVEVESIVMDLNGTIATDGKIPSKVKEKINALSEKASVYVLTVDTHGTAEEEVKDLNVELVKIPGEESKKGKSEFMKTLLPETTVAIKEGMDRFELIMDQSAVYKHRQFPSLVDILFKITHCLHHFLGWRRDIERVFQCTSRRANPVLRFPELTRLFVPSTRSLHKNTMDLFDQPQAHGKCPQTVYAKIERPYVIDDLCNIIDILRLIPAFILKKILKRRLRTFNL